MYQIIIKKLKIVIKEDIECIGRTSFSGHLIQFIWFRCKSYFRVAPTIKYTYLACLKVALWFVFAMYGLFVCFYGLLGGMFPYKISILDFWKGSEYASAE